LKEKFENNIVELASKELRQFKDALQALPEMSLNKLELDASWDEIRAGIVKSKTVNRTKSPRWAWMSLAASTTLMAVLLLNNNQQEMIDDLIAETDISFNVTKPININELVAEREIINDILALKQFNQVIENRLAALPEKPGLVRANTMDTITRLEDQIAFLDYRLDMQEHEPLNEDEYRDLWQQRAKSMNGLYQVRVAQVQGLQQQPRFEHVAYYD